MVQCSYCFFSVSLQKYSDATFIHIFEVSVHILSRGDCEPMTNKSTVLVAECKIKSSDALPAALEANGYRPITAGNGNAAISMISSHCPDIALLSAALPDINGLEVLRNVRQWSSIPIIIISAHGSESEEVKALDMGADDYIKQPFGIPGLLARIRTALRHSVCSDDCRGIPSGVLSRGRLVIDSASHSVSVDSKVVHLTQNEYRILLLLAKHPGKVLTYSYIIEQVWGRFAIDDRQLLRVNMANIRKKIELDPSNPKYIVTEVGIGYRMA